MDSSFFPGNSPRNQMNTFQDLIQDHEFTNQILWSPENVKFGPKSTDFVAVDQDPELFNNSSTLPTMNMYTTSQIPHISINTTSSSDSLDGCSSIGRNKMVKSKRGSYIRKRLWTSTLITSLIEDGYVWRKYGQKEIINAKHKRSYFRCTYKIDQGCQATKQVQKIEGDPPKYKITYNQHHTCNNFLGTSEIILDPINNNDTSVLLSFESNGDIEKEQVGSGFLSYTHEKSKEMLPSLELRDNQISFDHCLPHNFIMPKQSGLIPLTSSRLEHRDVISTGVYSPIFEIDHTLETINYSENPFDLAHCELTSFN